MNLFSRTFCSEITICLLLFSIGNLQPAYGQEEAAVDVDNDAPLSAAGRIIRDSSPTTPSELIRAIDQLTTFGDTDLANIYARQLGEKGGLENKADLVALGDSVGTQPVFRIANNRNLDESGRSFCQEILAAMQERDLDPQRLQHLAKLAVDNDLQIRRDALLKLRVAGSPAVNALVSILLTGSPTEQEAAQKGLLFLGTSAVSPLLAVLETSNQDLRLRVLAILTQLADPLALDDIRIATLASSDENKRQDIARKTRRSIRHYLQAKKSIVEPAAIPQIIWEWDDQKAVLTTRSGSHTLQAAKAACRLAHALYLADPTETNAILQAVAMLQYEKLNNGISLPLDYSMLVKRQSLNDEQKQNLKTLDFLESVFETALYQGSVPATIGAAELLHQHGVSAGEGIILITRRGADPHPLVEAMQHQDRRVRLAACKAIIAFAETVPFTGDSDQSDQKSETVPYAGASVAVDALRYLAASQGKPRVLIADRRLSRRQSLASMIKSAGYEPDIYSSGRAAIKAAQQHPDYVAIFISFTIGPRPIGDILHEFRSDAQTAGLPIGVLVDSNNEHRAENLIADDPLSTLFFMPHTAELAATDIKKLILLAGGAFVPEKERLAQAATALVLFKKISQQSSDGYEPNRWVPILKQSLQQAEHAGLAIDILAYMEAPTAQVVLADAVSNSYLPLPTRRRAAKAFKQHVMSYGIGLSKLEIQQQKDRYDSTKGKGPEEEELHWSILESLNQATEKGRLEPAQNSIK
ncbi:MAG: hypothetical protein VXZ84_03850 [Planctomycetota bacterium]|nr:hypothetical protein [Planctomycetota bacterium]